MSDWIMKITSFLIIFTLIWGMRSSVCATHTMELTSDFLQIAIPSAGLTTSFYLQDFKGSREFLQSGVSTITTTYALKSIINSRRPSHGKHSFPSGHAALAFFGSGFIHKRYGIKYAIPAYCAATFVGYSRIKSKEHWINDVIGGAAIGLFYSFLFTTSYEPEGCQFYSSLSADQITLFCEKNF